MPPRPGTRVPTPGLADGTPPAELEAGLGLGGSASAGRPQGTIGRGPGGALVFQMPPARTPESQALPRATRSIAAAIRRVAAQANLQLRAVSASSVEVVDARTGDVRIEGPSTVRWAAERDIVFEAWLRAIIVRSNDVSHAEKTAREGTIDAWSALVDEWAGIENTLAEQTLVEIERILAVKVDECEYESLLRIVLDGDASVAKHLECVAFRVRDTMAFRFARAAADGKAGVAAFLGRQVRRERGW